MKEYRVDRDRDKKKTTVDEIEETYWRHNGKDNIKVEIISWLVFEVKGWQLET